MKIQELQNAIAQRINKWIPESRIRWWEKHGLLLEIERSDTNQRQYTQDDVEKILVILALKSLQLSVVDMEKLMREENEALLKAVVAYRYHVEYELPLLKGILNEVDDRRTDRAIATS